VEKNNEESRRTFNKNSCDLRTAITHTEILVARCIFLIKSESVSDLVAHYGKQFNKKKQNHESKTVDVSTM